MHISVINHTNGQIVDRDLQRVIRAINRQIAEDFAPHWHMSATLRLEGRSQKKPSKNTLVDMRGDAVLYLWDEVNVDEAVGYHDLNNRGVPYGFVFTKIAKDLGEHWSSTLSHEALELIADPDVNLLVAGPHPSDPKRTVYHWYEMCDAVQDETYDIDGVEVSNFVLPLYFTEEAEPGSRNDFLGHRHKGESLRSFGINPGGYIGFFDADSDEPQTFGRKADRRAATRMAIKSRAGLARRSTRYKALIPHRPAAARKTAGLKGVEYAPLAAGTPRRR